MFVRKDLLIAELSAKFHNYSLVHKRDTFDSLVKHDLHSRYYRLRVIDNILLKLFGQHLGDFPLDKDFVVLVKEFRLSS